MFVKALSSSLFRLWCFLGATKLKYTHQYLMYMYVVYIVCTAVWSYMYTCCPFSEVILYCLSAVLNSLIVCYTE